MTHLRALPSLDANPTLEALVCRDVQAYTFGELVALSSERKVRTALARGALTRLLPNTYVATVHAPSFWARADAALLWAGPGAALAGVSALFAWRIVRDVPERVHIVVPAERRLRCPDWLVATRISYAVPTTAGRWPTVTPAVAIAQGYGALPRRTRSDSIYAAFRAGALSPVKVAEAMDLVPRVPARRELQRKVDSALRGAESFLEEAGLNTVFVGERFVGLLAQHHVSVLGKTYRLDLYDELSRTAIELDGARFHSDPAQRERDIARDVALATIGIQTLRFSYWDIVHRPQWCRERAHEVIATRSL